MPVIEKSTFNPVLLIRNKHLQTCLPKLLRRISLPYFRERLELTDGDFVDIDLLCNGSRNAVILNHGLEGSSSSKYILGMAQSFSSFGFDVLAWNYRGCSGELNRFAHSYHSGRIDDLNSVIEFAAARGYETISLVGFSLGGNLTLKYLGELSSRVPPIVKSAVVFSAPCDLKESAIKLSEARHWLYMSYFAKCLREKLRARFTKFPQLGDVADIERCRTFFDFDSYYTAPAHGFRDALEYWRKCSARSVLPQIQIPTLIVNAADDPCLGPRCSPREVVNDLPNLFLECPLWGGHNGFFYNPLARMYWSEQRAAEFVKNVLRWPRD